MRYTTSQEYDGMGEFIFRKWHDGELEADDEFRDDTGDYSFAQFGRRVLVDVEGTSLEYERFESVAEASQRMGELHDGRPPTEFDAIVQDGRGGYFVSVEGVRVGTYDDRDVAYLALARWMVDAGCFPDAFYVYERDGYFRIDADIRVLHDAGGDQMRPDLTKAL